MYLSLDFYQRIGLQLSDGDPTAGFTSFRIGEEQFLNLIAAPVSINGWGRIIERVPRVDTLYQDLKKKEFKPEALRDGE